MHEIEKIVCLLRPGSTLGEAVKDVKKYCKETGKSYADLRSDDTAKIVRHKDWNGESPDFIKSETGAVSFETLNRHMAALAKKKNIVYKSLDLARMFDRPEFFAFVKNRGPLEFFPHVISQAQVLLEELEGD